MRKVVESWMLGNASKQPKAKNNKFSNPNVLFVMLTTLGIRIRPRLKRLKQRGKYETIKILPIRGFVEVQKSLEI